MRDANQTGDSQKILPPRLLAADPWLVSYARDIELRIQNFCNLKKTLLGDRQSLSDWANGHHYFGFHRTDEGWVYREWAPAADALYLIGDFNQWHRTSHPLSRRENGVWEIELAGTNALPHGSRVKVAVNSRGNVRDRIPLYIRKVIQDSLTHDFSGQIWAPAQSYVWQNDDFRIDAQAVPYIYEVHIGMAQEEPGVGSYRDFTRNVLPRIKKQGYNTVQIMAVMEHPYYASFGYHVANYFAASSWFGQPEDLKELIDQAHQMGIAVLMDIVQSHAVKNYAEGINSFDGSEEQFFHLGERGNHSAWDSKLFNYGKHDVIHFLLSSLKFWLEEYRFDGFRFDGVTSMIYQDHGLGTAFDSYDKYFSMNTDLDALAYLQLANQLIREIRPDAWTIAEDMSGMPGMCVPAADGGIGFDYRLAMGVPDFWIKLLEQRDEDWPMQNLWYELTTSRPAEKRIAYVESHDQALVGDKTMIFRMADQEMYWHMHQGSQNLIIERAIALHKMIRLITISTGAEGYLNFMGNEFGHPEWIDFPRQGNGWSYAYCRRQWNLVDDPTLRYRDLNEFDRAMLELMQSKKLAGGSVKDLWLDQQRKIIAYADNEAIFIFNFHPNDSVDPFQLPLHHQGQYRVVLDTDEKRFGGQNRIDHQTLYNTAELPELSGDLGINIYVPCRTAVVLLPDQG